MSGDSLSSVCARASSASVGVVCAVKVAIQSTVVENAAIRLSTKDLPERLDYVTQPARSAYIRLDWSEFTTLRSKMLDN